MQVSLEENCNVYEFPSHVVHIVGIYLGSGINCNEVNASFCHGLSLSSWMCPKCWIAVLSYAILPPLVHVPNKEDGSSHYGLFHFSSCVWITLLQFQTAIWCFLILPSQETWIPIWALVIDWSNHLFKLFISPFLWTHMILSINYFVLLTSIFIYLSLKKLGGHLTLVEISLLEEVHSSHLVHVKSSGVLSCSPSCFGEGGCFFLVCRLGTMYLSCLGISFSALELHIESPYVPHPLLFEWLSL